MNYYELLGVSKNATDEEIRFAYRQRAKEFHPDKQGGSTEKMAELNKAKKTLLDKKLRASYDEGGSTEDVTDITPVEARNLLFSMFDAVLTELPEEANPVQVVNAFLKEHIFRQLAQIEELNTNVERFKRMRDRVQTKRDGADNLFHFYADKKISDTRTSIDALQNIIKITELAQTLMKELYAKDTLRIQLTGDQRVVMTDAYKDFFGLS